ncbi:MAG TPA: hypothetical protein DGG94_06695 [Micromonosporaceae bacterium]|nr:hypothetical protein [Micromonosporaceae bacterium]HCU49475.1 hypothetical protein [Micromonosporaceae bacterium]
MTKVGQTLGRWGEDIAAKYLVEQGMVILDRNWRTASGEIDIIARDANAVIFCEQKLQDLRQANPLWPFRFVR